VDVGSACVDIGPSPKTDVLVNFIIITIVNSLLFHSCLNPSCAVDCCFICDWLCQI